MSLFRNILLWCSENNWLKSNLPRYGFVKKAVKKFMPGESSLEALNAAKNLQRHHIPTVFTKLGENITSLLEASATTGHYIKLLEDIEKEKIDSEVSVKLTQIGFDLSVEETFKNLSKITAKSASLGKMVWIDMERSGYTQASIDFYKRILAEYPNTGLCIQAYLYRSEKDITGLIELKGNIRLVKGAYKESETTAIKLKKSVDENYYKLACILLKGVKEKKIRAAFATHDLGLIERISAEALRTGVTKEQYEFQMLYGIRSNDQKLMTEKGIRLRTLISYGESWYAWYLRRLAERPANLWFVIKNIF